MDVNWSEKVNGIHGGVIQNWIKDLQFPGIPKYMIIWQGKFVKIWVYLQSENPLMNHKKNNNDNPSLIELKSENTGKIRHIRYPIEAARNRL